MEPSRNSASRRSHRQHRGTRPETSRSASGPATFAVAVAILLALIAYGSLYPLTWDFQAPRDFVFLGPVGLVDLAENIVLFIPLGCVLAWHYEARGRRLAGFAVWLVVALVFASVLQWLQKYLPRTPALSDIVFNMMGHLLGWCLGHFSARAVARLLQRHQKLREIDRFALVLAGIWIVAELFPLIPTLDVSSLAANIKSLWQQDPWQPGRMLQHMGMTVLGLEALAQLLRSVAWERHLRALCGMAALAVLAGKFVVIGQSPGLAVVLGIVGGALAWWAIDMARKRRRLFLVFVVAGATYLVFALAPYSWQEPPSAMRWVPFTSSLQSGIIGVISSVAFECLCYGALIWSAARMGASVPGITAGVALLAFGGEWIQQYLPGRTAEISSVLLALGMGWLVASLRGTPWRRQAPAIHGVPAR